MNERLKYLTDMLNCRLSLLGDVLEHQRRFPVTDLTTEIKQDQCEQVPLILAAIRAARQESRPTVDNSQSAS